MWYGKAKGSDGMLGARLAALRLQAGMTQAELARALSVSSSAVGMYEQGRREPSLDRIVALSRLFGVSADFLLTGELLTPGDRNAMERVIGVLRARADREIVLRRTDGSQTRLSTRELAMACAAVLG